MRKIVKVYQVESPSEYPVFGRPNGLLRHS